MTTQQLHLFNALYLGFLVVAAILTRATARRITGAIVAGVVIGIVLLGIVTLGERAGLWRMVITWEPYFLLLFMIGGAVGGFLYLITWRIARRFGGRGLAVATVVAAVIGPPRDYWYMAHFPEWGHYAPGIAPVIAISVSYAVIVLLGHAVMRLVAGPARADRLARGPWEVAAPSDVTHSSRDSASSEG
ncbi:MAG TPA: hypothetical protein VGY53_13360 [Isosphaeraceae bacterium]|nr:hypothetical protein [Isosphaeraceae bacterium]